MTNDFRVIAHFELDNLIDEMVKKVGPRFDHNIFDIKLISTAGESDNSLIVNEISTEITLVNNEWDIEERLWKLYRVDENGIIPIEDGEYDVLQR